MQGLIFELSGRMALRETIRGAVLAAWLYDYVGVALIVYSFWNSKVMALERYMHNI